MNKKEIQIKTLVFITFTFFGLLFTQSKALAATLTLSPSSGTVAVGSNLVVDIMVDTQGADIDGVDVESLHYNKALLEVQDASSSETGVQISAGNLFSQTLTVTNAVDATNGTITFSQVNTGATNFNGTGKLATITFKGLAPGTSALTFDFTSGSTSDSNVAGNGIDKLTSVGTGSFTVTSVASYGTPAYATPAYATPASYGTPSYAVPYFTPAYATPPYVTPYASPYVTPTSSSGSGSGSKTGTSSSSSTSTTTSIPGCTGKTGYSSISGKSCAGNTTTTTTTSGTGTTGTTTSTTTTIPGCVGKTGYSSVSGKSCAGNTVSTTTTGTYNFGTVTLRNGSRGEAVKELQRFLNRVLNLGLVIDGVLGPKTIAVVVKWQKDHGLVPDGLIGAKTKAMMNASVAAQ